MFTHALVRFPPTSTKEIQYLNAKGAMTYIDIAGDPVLYGNLPPREISMKDVFRSGDSSKKFKIFFFQAEDGIRDYKVTGVQTCALPILLEGGSDGQKASFLPKIAAGDLRVTLAQLEPNARWDAEGIELQARKDGGGYRLAGRSEERRVGKECRSRWSPYHLKKKKG